MLRLRICAAHPRSSLARRTEVNTRSCAELHSRHGISAASYWRGDLLVLRRGSECSINAPASRLARHCVPIQRKALRARAACRSNGGFLAPMAAPGAAEVSSNRRQQRESWQHLDSSQTGPREAGSSVGELRLRQSAMLMGARHQSRPRGGVGRRGFSDGCKTSARRKRRS